MRRFGNSARFGWRLYSSAKTRPKSAKKPLSPVFGVVSGIAIGFGVAGLVLRKTGYTDDRSIAPLDSLKPLKYGGNSEKELAFREIEEIVGVKYASRESSDLQGHAPTAFGTYHSAESPNIIVYPESTEQVSAIMKVAHKYSIPVIPFSGGTSLEGHFAAVREGICIDFARMNNIVAVHPGDLDVVVQPGVGWEDLNEQLSSYDLFFPPDPGPGALIGGMIGTSCSGTNAARYGTMRENVVNLTVVLADGTVIKTRGRPRKSSAGYNLTQLFVGSEGTLGVVTEATLKLTPKPKNERIAVVSFNSIADAAKAVENIVQDGIMLGAVELLDDNLLKAINTTKLTSRRWDEKPSLFLKFNGPSKKTVEEQIKAVKGIAKKWSSTSFDFASSVEDNTELWAARKAALWAVIDSNPKSYSTWTTDVAVPLSSLAKAIVDTQRDVEESGLNYGIVGHSGDGNYHMLISYDKEKHFDQVEQLVHNMMTRAVDLEGTITGEHGIGIGKRDELIKELGEDVISTMRRLKLALDPKGILNPDKVIQVNK
ncbi:D-lactate dehydrogenase [cytochrome] 1, mitochondrial [Trichomonascus vanleenenianus]|uniref:FAD-binding oxidoreductase n=1 Tax=Trichomonascus vanleenenianus TaxID=2268995 RepID=UPI003EC96CC4